MRVTATETTSRSASLCAQAERATVFAEKARHNDTVRLPSEHNQALQASLASRRKAFGAEFGDWIAEQRALFEQHGIPGADLRPW